MNILSKFSENLFSLMQENNLNAPALAKIINTDRSNITRYLNAERLPSFNCFVKLIEHFNLSADVMLGIKDYSLENTFLPIKNFGERLRFVMQETHTTQYQIEKQLKISGASMYNWLFKEVLPSVENLLKLSTFMGVSVDYLLGRIK